MTEFVDATDLNDGQEKNLKTRRLQRKVIKDGVPSSWIQTQTVVVTFEGQNLPEYIFTVADSRSLRLCRKCLRFVHTQAQCRSDVRCFMCPKASRRRMQYRSWACYLLVLLRTTFPDGPTLSWALQAKIDQTCNVGTQYIVSRSLYSFPGRASTLCWRR